MLPSSSRWLREGPAARVIPTRFISPIERFTLAHAYPRAPEPLRWVVGTSSPEASLLLGGDLALHRWEPLSPPASTFSGLAELAGTADAFILNLESQLTTRPTALGTIGTSLKASPGAAGILSYLGVRAVTCANNHSLDYGPEGLEESAEVLERTGVAVTGIAGQGRDGGAVITVRRIRVGLLGFSDDWRVGENGVSWLRPVPHLPEQVKERISALRASADVVVVQLHWGYEWSMYPMRSQRDLARSYVEAGADLVVCHHAHVPMGIETWRGGAIAHGLGNLHFGPSGLGRHPFRNSSFALRAGITRSGVVTLEAVPVTTDGEGRTAPATGPAAEQIRNALGYLSSRLDQDRYLDAVEAALLARQGCGVLLDLSRRIAQGDAGGAAERVRFLDPPRQRVLAATLRGAGGVLGGIGTLLEEVRDGKLRTGGPPFTSALERLRGPAERLLSASPQKGRIP